MPVILKQTMPGRGCARAPWLDQVSGDRELKRRRDGGIRWTGCGARQGHPPDSNIRLGPCVMQTPGLEVGALGMKVGCPRDEGGVALGEGVSPRMAGSPREQRGCPRTKVPQGHVSLAFIESGGRVIAEYG